MNGFLVIEAETDFFLGNRFGFGVVYRNRTETEIRTFFR